MAITLDEKRRKKGTQLVLEETSCVPFNFSGGKILSAAVKQLVGSLAKEVIGNIINEEPLPINLSREDLLNVFVETSAAVLSKNFSRSTNKFATSIGGELANHLAEQAVDKTFAVLQGVVKDALNDIGRPTGEAIVSIGFRPKVSTVTFDAIACSIVVYNDVTLDDNPWALVGSCTYFCRTTPDTKVKEATCGCGCEFDFIIKAQGDEGGKGGGIEVYENHKLDVTKVLRRTIQPDKGHCCQVDIAAAQKMVNKDRADRARQDIADYIRRAFLRKDVAA